MTFDNAIETMRKVLTSRCYENYSWCERYENCEKCRLGAIAEIQSAHDADMEHAKKSEYRRGYEDGRNFVNPDEWQLEQHRRYVADRLRKYRDAPPVQTLEIGNSDAIEIDAYTFVGILSAVMYPVTEFPTSMLIDKLIYLLVGKMPEGADSAIYGNWEKAEVIAKTTASKLQNSSDLTSCHELGKLLKKTLGEAKCVHDRLKDQSKSHADLKDENRRLKGECRMYRTMLNDATWEFTNLAAKHEAAEKFMECATSCGYIAVDVHNNALRIKDERYKELEKVVDECLGDNLMYRTMLNDAKEDYVRLMDERDKLGEQCAEYERATTGYKERAEAFADSERLRRELEAERDKLRRNVALWRDRSEDMRKERDDAEFERDKYKAACEAAQSLNRDMMDGLKDYIELPKGEDGEHIRMGDIVRHGDAGEPFEVSVITFYAKDDAFVADESNEGIRAKYCNHVTQPDPIEETFRKYELGNLTSSEAIERIKEATNVG